MLYVYVYVVILYDQMQTCCDTYHTVWRSCQLSTLLYHYMGQFWHPYSLLLVYNIPELTKRDVTGFAIGYLFQN